MAEHRNHSNAMRIFVAGPYRGVVTACHGLAGANSRMLSGSLTGRPLRTMKVRRRESLEPMTGLPIPS